MFSLVSLRPFGAVTLSLALAGCFGMAEEAAHGGFPPPAVSTLTVTPADLPVTREYTGITAGTREVEVRARVSGFLKLRAYDEGAAVKAGDLLFEIDDAPYRAQLAAAQAELARAVAERDRAVREQRRLKPLTDANVSSRRDYDNAVADEALAVAGVQAAEAAVTTARLNLDYTRVTAPISGITGTADAVEGTLVAAGDTLLTRLTQADPLYVQFAMAENEWLAQQRDVNNGSLVVPNDKALEVRVKLADGELLERIGRIDFRDVRLDSQTGTVALRATLPNADGRLKAGQFVRAVISGALRPQAVVVPQSAVLEGPQGKFVYVVGKGDDGQPIATFRPIEVGEWVKLGDGGSGRQWLVRSGLAAGEQVILDNLIKVRPGAPVQLDSGAAAGAAEGS